MDITRYLKRREAQHVDTKQAIETSSTTTVIAMISFPYQWKSPTGELDLRVRTDGIELLLNPRP
jgi:hypothetical protein